MRIGIDVRLWNESGVGRYIRNLVREINDLDTKNDYVLFIQSSDAEKLKEQITNVKNKKWKVVEVNIRWHSLSEQMRFPSILQKEHLDLMHFPYFSVPIYYPGKFVVTIHDLILHSFPTGQATTLPLPMYHAKRMGYKFIIAQAAKRAAKIITVSEATKTEIVKRLSVDSEKVIVTYEGVDQALSIRDKEKEKGIDTLYKILQTKYFLYVGNAYPHKNIERLLEAFSFVSKHTDVKLVFVGEDDFFYQRLREKVHAVGLEDNVMFAGFVDDQELASLYHHAKALIVPSFMEGFSLPPLEGMAQQCLVVSSDIPAHREICQDAVLYFDPYDTNALSRIMQDVLENKVDRDQLVEKGKKRVGHFSWETMAKETLAVYTSV